MNEDLTNDWVKRVWGFLNFGRRLLVWDAHKCHIMESVRSYVDKQTNTDVSVIPGGLTSHLQLADVSWNKPFKTAYKAKYNQWMVIGPKSYTAAGNMRAQSKAMCLEWVRDCWEALPTELIQNSFRACGISVDIDGKCDGEIHSLKAGGVTSDAREPITVETTSLLSGAIEDSEEDPFADMTRTSWRKTKLSWTTAEHCKNYLFRTLLLTHVPFCGACAAFNRGRRLFRSALCMVRRFLEGGVYSRKCGISSSR